MRRIKLFLFALFMMPFGAFAAPTEFQVAAQLLAAAKNADIQQVQALVNNGADINYVDSTGLSLVCTALMNNDVRAAQILQMYGADASKCDRQIKSYKSKSSPKRSSRFFGGLSTAQGVTLAAAGAAVIVGGIFLLTDWFDPDNDNKGINGGTPGGGSGGGGSGGGSGGDSASALFPTGLPYGPLLPSADAETANYAENLSLYYNQYGQDGTTESIYYKDFNTMNALHGGNYLYLMRGYSPLARGYLGMRTLRNPTNQTPLSFGNAEYGGEQVIGGRPINVALVTANGVNSADSTSLQNVFRVWTTGTGAGGFPVNYAQVSGKYYNNKIDYGPDPVHSPIPVQNYMLDEDLTVLVGSAGATTINFDFSNSGTVVHNTAATALDDILAKIVGGNFETGINGDFAGFMPNGQMTIFRTGGGLTLTAVGTPETVGSYSGTSNIAVGDTLTFTANGIDATVISTVTTATDTGVRGLMLSYEVDDETKYLDAYVVNNLLYVDFDGNGAAEYVYSFGSDNNLMSAFELTGMNYKNYHALWNAALIAAAGNGSYGRSGVSIIANTDVIEPLHLASAPTINTIRAQPTVAKFAEFIDATYGVADETAFLLPSTVAKTFFERLGIQYNPLVVFSTGGAVLGNGDSQLATFENGAPLVFSNFEHLFMSVVAVSSATDDVQSISPEADGNPNPYTLSQWTNGSTTNPVMYQSRICGVAGTGDGDVDPWCFAAVGMNDEMATAAAAGAAGVLMSAFDYMTPQQIFMLMALTADGPFLHKNFEGALDENGLVRYLSEMYTLPGDIAAGVTTNAEYLAAFKQVFGYGVINLERATTPGTNLYFYTNGKIVSDTNNAYWRAALNTGFRGAAALNLGRAAIDTVAYDILESNDGSMQLPRIWKNSFTLSGNTGHHGLYMGDVLRDLRVRDDVDKMYSIGNLSFGFARSEREYDDGFGGMDNIRLKYSDDKWSAMADYQRYLTDGESRFSGMANPILSLATYAVSGGAQYNYGRFSFGGRAFSGAITDEGLLQNDPVISSNFEPLKLGAVMGAESEVSWHGDRFAFGASAGVMHEDGTVLGSYGSGLFATNNSDTRYVDATVMWRPFDSVRLRGRATFATTAPGLADSALIGISELKSNSFAVSADIGRFSFGASLPLAVYSGNLSYDWADYDIVEVDNGYDLVMNGAGRRYIDAATHSREVRFNATYRHSFGEFTDGAIGAIYRVNPNNTDEFGNETLLMMKLSHRLGI